MQIRVTQKGDMAVSLLSMQSPETRREIMEGVGMQLVSMAKRSFQEPGLRPSDWPARLSGGSHQLLKKSGSLWRSLRVASVTSNKVTCASDRVYAGIHQHGGTIRAKSSRGMKFPINGGWVNVQKVTMPARPFFPILPSGALTETAKQKTHRLIWEALQDARQRG